MFAAVTQWQKFPLVIGKEVGVNRLYFVKNRASNGHLFVIHGITPFPYFIKKKRVAQLAGGSRRAGWTSSRILEVIFMRRKIRREQFLRGVYVVSGVVFFASCATLAALIVLFGTGTIQPTAQSYAVEAAGVLGCVSGMVVCESMEALRK